MNTYNVAQTIARELARLQRIESDPAHPNYHTNKLNAIETIARMERDYMPHGSGFDAGCTVDMDKSTPEKVVILCPYHHMDEHGGYDGWEDYTVIVTPSLQWGMNVSVKGGRKDHREYIAETVGYDIEQVPTHISA
jgi:hypothetical protein